LPLLLRKSFLLELEFLGTLRVDNLA